jgi:hypothetical protein
LLAFRNLRIRAIGRTSYRGVPHVTIKMALGGKEDAVIDEVVVDSKLSYPRKIEGVLAWLQLGIGYLLDDVEGLNSVLGGALPPPTWIPVVPVHRIGNRYIRKPLSVVWGIITLYYFVICLFPLFLPFLFSGPYWELRLLAGNEMVSLLEKASKVELKRPFIVRAGGENMLTISYRPSLYFKSVLMTKLFLQNARVSYVNRPPGLRTIRLPRGNEFTWKVTDVVRVKVGGKMRRYSIKLEDGYANVYL